MNSIAKSNYTHLKVRSLEVLQLRLRNSAGKNGADGRPDSTNGHALAAPKILPHWNALRRELIVGGQVVKRFRVPAPNQEAVLTAFEEEGWPQRVYDPLSPNGDTDTKNRLHQTIKARATGIAWRGSSVSAEMALERACAGNLPMAGSSQGVGAWRRIARFGQQGLWAYCRLKPPAAVAGPPTPPRLSGR